MLIERDERWLIERSYLNMTLLAEQDREVALATGGAFRSLRSLQAGKERKKLQLKKRRNEITQRT